MYRLMKSDKLTLEHVISGRLSSYRQIEVNHFQKFGQAYEACKMATDKDGAHYYLLNDSGQEYYDGTWIA